MHAWLDLQNDLWNSVWYGMMRGEAISVIFGAMTLLSANIASRFYVDGYLKAREPD